VIPLRDRIVVVREEHRVPPVELTIAAETRCSGREETPPPPFNNVLYKARSLLKLIHVDGV